MLESFDIIFVEGQDYIADQLSQLKDYMQVIKNSFCLLSWLIPDFQIRIKEQISIGQTENVKIFSKRYQKEKYYIHERHHGDKFYYSIGKVDEKQSQQKLITKAVNRVTDDWGIVAEFVSKERVDNWSIRVRCKTKDECGLTFRDVFLNDDQNFSKSLRLRFNYFKPPCKKSTREKVTLKDIQYYYIQPENRRYLEPEGYHINLAFQGGGAKGVSYVGVNRAIQKLQSRIDRDSDGEIKLPIKSVIGSSAGGILSLAISASISNDDLIDLCYMMDTLIQDLLIPTEQKAEMVEHNPAQFNHRYQDNIKHNFFAGQEKGFKNVLHNLGLVQDSLSDIIFETLRQPSVQQRIIALFTAINPSIASLLSFKGNPMSEGESIKNICGSCCCCCYSNCCWNCCGSYPCCRSVPGTSCFIEVSSSCRKVNLYGLLYAALMTGTAVENILAYALSLFLGIQAEQKSPKLLQICKRRRWLPKEGDLFDAIVKYTAELRERYRNRINKEDYGYLDNPLIDVAKALTLSQYYELNGVEFTCTSVDLHDKIQRFFNHKTAPDLPICKAVQMTGSFPAAFLSLKWSKDWGKYYVHYDKTRREINLEGHHFTDGGLLANFPLKFLDNQKFRQKYFSHKRVENKTILYGFGLDQLQDFPEDNNSQAVDACLSSLLAQFKYRLLYKLVIYLMKCSNKDTLAIKNVKLLDFLVSLLDAMRESDRNLNRQCFREEIIETILDKRPIQTYEEFQKLKMPIKSLLQGFSSKMESHFRKSNSQFINEELNAIYEHFEQHQRTYKQDQPRAQQTFDRKLAWKKVEQIQWRIQDNLLLYSPGCIDIYQNRIKQFKTQYGTQNVFMTSMTLHHEGQILKLLHDFKAELITLSQSEFGSMMIEMRENCKKFLEQLKKIYGSMGAKDKRGANIENESFMKQKQAVQLLHLKYRLSPYMIKAFNDSENSLNETHKTAMISYCVEEYTYLNRNSIRTRIRNQILQKKNEILERNAILKNDNPMQLHIILQARYFSHLYFPNYMKIVEEVIADKDIKIDIISCSDYHAIFGVFYVMGYETAKIKKRLAEVQYLFEENPQINEIYDSQEWMKTSVEQIKALLRRQWEKTENPFDLIEQQYEKMENTIQDAQKKTMHANFNRIADNFEASQQEINSAFEKILDYLSGSFRQIVQLSANQRKDRFEQLLSLGKYEKLNASRSKKGQEVLTHFLKYTINLLMLTAQHVFKSQQYTLFSSKKWNKETLFKGMVLNSLLSAFKYRLYIFDILDKAGLDRNITLQKFYDTCTRKILLNFNVANTSQQRFALINKFTKPNMPLWAALMASASLPYLQGEFGSRRQWEMKEKGDIQIEQADVIFRNFEAQGSASGNNYISGNFISSLPVEFMTNQRLVVSKLSDKKDPQIIEIVFAFQENFAKTAQSQLQRGQARPPQAVSSVSNDCQIQSFLDQLPNLMQGKRRFLNCWDAINYLCEYVCKCCCKLDVGWYFSDLLTQINTLKMLNMRVNSHDNLILNLYYDRLIKLPLRIGTLDFYKISKDRPDLEDTILQAEEVVRQLCDTIQFNPKTRQLYPAPSQISTVQVSNHKCDIFNPQTKQWQRSKQFYRIKFISYTKWRNFNYKYVIEYALDTKRTSAKQTLWQQVKNDYLDIPRAQFINNSFLILLRFTYYDKTLISHSYLLSMPAIQQLALDPARAIFSINYRKNQFTEEKIQTINQLNAISSRIIIKPYFLPRGSNLCTNLACTAPPLEYVLNDESQHVCISCKRQQLLQDMDAQADKPRLIAMKCPKCEEKFCLRCKIGNFIVRKSTNTNFQDSYTYFCPKNKKSYSLKQAPIVLKGKDKDIPKSNCLVCGKYAYKLRYQEGIEQAGFPQNRTEFCGLRICETCSLYITA